MGSIYTWSKIRFSIPWESFVTKRHHRTLFHVWIRPLCYATPSNHAWTEISDSRILSKHPLWILQGKSARFSKKSGRRRVYHKTDLCGKLDLWMKKMESKHYGMFELLSDSPWEESHRWFLPRNCPSPLTDQDWIEAWLSRRDLLRLHRLFHRDHWSNYFALWFWNINLNISCFKSYLYKVKLKKITNYYYYY